MTLIDDSLPTLDIPSPECSHCRQAVEMEDEIAWCPRCRVRWDRIFDGEDSQPDQDHEGAETPCAKAPPVERNEYDHRSNRVTITYRPCILPSGHESKCLHPYVYESTPLVAATERKDSA